MIREHQDAPHAPLLWLVGLALLTLAFLAGCTRAPGAPVGRDGTRRGVTESSYDEDAPDYDPWQPFNEVMFSFNHDVLDRFLVKPAATGWEAITPLPVRRSIARAFDNLEMPRRLVNNVLQLRPLGAGRELARFVVNTTAGVGGLFDVATLVGLEERRRHRADLRALRPHPRSVPRAPDHAAAQRPRAVGRGVDGLLDPIGYFMPFVANQAKSILSAVNDARST
jgi:hypothetical protein